jgi:hypothetical protein
MSNARDDLLCGQRVVLGDIGGLLIEIQQRRAQPYDFQGR